MPITSGSFYVQNSNPAMTAQLNMALAYLQQSPTAAVFLQMASDAGVQIGMNPKGTDNYPDVSSADPGRDVFDSATHTVYWNPAGAMEIRDAQNNIVGVQSAALGLLHEIIHSIDPALLSNLYERIPAFRNLAEYTAVQYESMVARDLGEQTRDNSRGTDIVTSNSTAHTMMTEAGLIWTQENEHGQNEYGTYYSSPGATSSGSVPDFGSSGGGGAGGADGAELGGNENDFDPTEWTGGGGGGGGGSGGINGDDNGQVAQDLTVGRVVPPPAHDEFLWLVRGESQDVKLPAHFHFADPIPNGDVLIIGTHLPPHGIEVF